MNTLDKYTLFRDIMAYNSKQCGFWHGNPTKDSQEKLYRYFGVENDFELGLKLGDTFFWVLDGWGIYKHPENELPFELYNNRNIPHLKEFTDDDIDLVGKLNWPNAEYYDFTRFEEAKKLSKQHKIPIFSGSWAPFYHHVAYIFGMENYFIKMHTDPNLVIAVTERVVDFFLSMNEKLFNKYAPYISAAFFGNDFGTQLDLMISPEMFRRFIMPYQKKISDQAKTYGLYTFLHSCGSIVRVIPDIIDAGINGLHPIQANASGMHAENLAKKFKDKVVFLGGVDTQILLRKGTPKQIKEDVKRLKDLFGNNFILSPSHEAILPDVPPENIAAMAEAVWNTFA